MVHDKLPRYHRGFGTAILVVGLVFSTLFAALILGLPLVVIGLYMTGASRSVWRCPHCGAMTDRSET